MATVGSIQVADLLVALEALGAHASSLRDRAGIDRSQVEEPSARIPTQDVVRLLLVHPEGGPPGETAHAFGCPVRFDRRTSAVRMPLSTLAGRPFAANHLIAEQLEKMGNALLASVTASRPAR